MQKQFALVAKAKKLYARLSQLNTDFASTSTAAEQMALAKAVFSEVSTFIATADRSDALYRKGPYSRETTPLCELSRENSVDILEGLPLVPTSNPVSPKETRHNSFDIFTSTELGEEGTDGEDLTPRSTASASLTRRLDSMTPTTPKVAHSLAMTPAMELSATSDPTATAAFSATKPHQGPLGFLPSPPLPAAQQPTYHRTRTPGTVQIMSPSMSVTSAAGRPPVISSESVHKEVDDIGNKRINQYEVIDALGRGAYGKVKLVLDTDTEDLRALKIMNKSLLKNVTKPGGYTALHQAQREVAIMKKLKHRHLVQLYEVLDDPEQNKMYLVMQYVEGKLLQDDPDAAAAPGAYVPLRPTEVRKYMLQLTAALRYLHNHGIFHRDVKPDNILKGSDDNVYVADFGVSELTSGKLHNVEGTPAFFAPEMTSASDLDIEGAPLDVWALGVTLHCMLFGRNPFVRDSLPTTLKAIQTFTPTLPTLRAAAQDSWTAEDEVVYDDLCDLLQRMLEKDPAKRISLHDARHHSALAKDHVTERNGSLAHSDSSEGDSPLADFRRQCTADDIQNAIQMHCPNSPRVGLRPGSGHFAHKLRSEVQNATVQVA